MSWVCPSWDHKTMRIQEHVLSCEESGHHAFPYVSYYIALYYCIVYFILLYYTLLFQVNEILRNPIPSYYASGDHSDVKKQKIPFKLYFAYYHVIGRKSISWRKDVLVAGEDMIDF